MVKLPSIDELKKMGADLMNSAKNVDVGGVVDKIKSTVESVSEKFAGPQGELGIKNAFDRINAGLNELMQLQPNETPAIQQIQNNVKDLQKRIEATQPSQPSGSNP